MAGMIAANHVRGDLPLARWEDLPGTTALVVDVRSRGEFAQEHVPGAVNLPLEELRERLAELPRDRECWLVCGVGQRAYFGLRALMQLGLRVKILSGGMRTYRTFHVG
jgi:rhodanese-related sulfurtransferase